MDQTTSPARADAPDTEYRLLGDLGFFGHYLHIHAGGRSGKQHVLRKLLHNQGHLTQRELGEATDVSSAALSEVLAKLEAEGLITRTRSAADQRQRDIALTKAGWETARQCTAQDSAFRQVAFEPLSAEEREQLLSTLDRLREHWEGIERERVVSQGHAPEDMERVTAREQ